MSLARRLFALRSADRPVLKLVAPLFTCVVAANVVVVSWARALFITHNDFQALPWMFIAASVFTAVASVAYMAVIGKLALRTRFVGLILACAVTFVALALAIPGRERAWSLFAFAWTTGLCQLVLIQTWSFSAAVMPVRQARRLFPMFSAAATLGAAAGGAVVTGLLQVAGLMMLLYLAVLLLVAGAFFAHMASRSLREAVAQPDLDGGGQSGAGADDDLGGSDGVIRGLKDLQRTPLLRQLAWLAFFLQAASVMLDLQFSAVLKNEYEGQDMAAFLGGYYAVSNLATFVIALTLGQRMSRALGIGLAAGSSALVIAIGSAAASAFRFAGDTTAAGWSVLGMSFGERVVGFGVSKHALNAANTPVPPRVAERSRFLIDGVFHKGATIVVSVAFLLAGSKLQDFAAFSPAVLVAAGLAVAFGLRLGPLYRSALVTALRARRVEPADRERVRRWASREALRGVRHLVGSNRAEGIHQGLSLAEELGLALPKPLQSKLLDHADPTVVAATLRAMTQLRQHAEPKRVLPLLEPSREPDVLRAALQNLPRSTPAAVGRAVQGLVHHRDPLVACLAVMWLSLPEREAAGAAGRVLGRTRKLPHLQAAVAADGDVPDDPGQDFPLLSPAAAASLDPRALLGSSSLVPGDLVSRLLAFFQSIPAQLSDPDPAVRASAQLAVTTLRMPALVRPLLDAMDDPETRGGAIATLVRLGPDLVLPALDRELGRDDTPTPRRVRLVQLSERLGGAMQVSRHLDARDRVLRNHAVFALWRMARESGLGRGMPAREVVVGHLAAEIDALVRYVMLDELLMARKGPRVAFLRDELALLRAQGETRTFRLLGMVHPRHSMHRAYLHYRSPFRRTRSNAIELLDATLSEPELRPFIAYIESTEFSDGKSMTTRRSLLALPSARKALAEAQQAADAIDAIIPVHDAWLRGLWRWARPDPTRDAREAAAGVTLTRQIKAVRREQILEHAKRAAREGRSPLSTAGVTPPGPDARPSFVAPAASTPTSQPSDSEADAMVVKHDVMDRVFLLRSIPLFDGIPADQLLPLAEITEDVAFPAGKTVFEEGQPGSHLYLVVQGTVEVRRGDRVLATLGQRECFGEMALLDDSVRSATVVARDDVDCLVVDREDFQDLLDLTPAVAKGIIRVLTRRLRAKLDADAG